VPKPFDVDVRREGPAAIVAVTGAVDRASAPHVDAMLERIWESEVELVILDLRAVDFMDSQGLQSVISGDRRSAKDRRRFAVAVRPGDPVHGLLRRTAVLGKLTVVAAPEELLD
jgi:anti-anti-sigma factor